MADFPAPQPHGTLEELFPDIFLVRGEMKMGALVAIGRSMIVLREGTSLTLVNSIRLSEAGEKSLCALGEVKHLVRLGGYHGLDDPYYRARFSPTYWSPVAADKGAERLVDGAKGPIARSTIFAFQRPPRGEGALLIEQSGGNLLITCDSTQTWADTRHCSAVGSLMVRAMGFLSPAKIGPIWLKETTGGQPAAMWPDFERLLALDFEHLASGHGSLLRGGAKAAVTRSCERTLGPR